MNRDIKMKLGLVLLLGLGVVRAADLEEQLKEDHDRAAVGLEEAALEDATIEKLGTTLNGFWRMEEVEQIQIPYLPLIAFDTVSLALTEVSIFGLGDNELNLNLDGFNLNFPALTFYSGHYIVGGKLIDLNIVGESTANVTLQRFNVVFSVDRKLRCAQENTTAFSFTASDIFVNFADLNPGHDEQGVLINSMLESVGDDLLKWLSMDLSPGGALHAKVDPFIVDLINSKTGCSNKGDSVTPEEKTLPDLALKGKGTIEALKALAKYLDAVVGADFIEDVFMQQLWDSVNSHWQEMVASENVYSVY